MSTVASEERPPGASPPEQIARANLPAAGRAQHQARPSSVKFAQLSVADFKNGLLVQLQILLHSRGFSSPMKSKTNFVVQRSPHANDSGKVSPGSYCRPTASNGNKALHRTPTAGAGELRCWVLYRPGGLSLSPPGDDRGFVSLNAGRSGSSLAGPAIALRDETASKTKAGTFMKPRQKNSPNQSLQRTRHTAARR